MQALVHALGQQLVVMNLNQVVRDEPDWFLGCHPLLIVKARQVHRTRKPSQGALASHVEIGVEVAQSQLAQRTVHRLAKAAARRSEEHTSELQSRFELVCRLL